MVNVTIYIAYMDPMGMVDVFEPRRIYQVIQVDGDREEVPGQAAMIWSFHFLLSKSDRTPRPGEM